MQKKLTITVDPETYAGLHREVGRGHISHFIEDLVRPKLAALRVVSLDEQYALAALDLETEAEELEWCEALIEDAFDETR